MPSRKSTASLDTPFAPHPPTIANSSAVPFPPNPDNDISMLSTMSAPTPAAATSTPTVASATKPSKSSSASSSKQKDKDSADHAEGGKDKDATATPTPKDKEKEKDSLGIDDLLLPRTLLSRLARGVLPANTSISKDALLALTKASSVFISHLASTADELTTKKTIAPQDVLTALEEIEWGGLKGRCEGELKIWEDVNRGKRKGYRDRVKARESGVSNATNTTALDDESKLDGDSMDFGNDNDEERAGKRARVELIDHATSTTFTSPTTASAAAPTLADATGAPPTTSPTTNSRSAPLAPTTNGARSATNTYINGGAPGALEDHDQTEPEDEDGEDHDDDDGEGGEVGGGGEEVSSEEEDEEAEGDEEEDDDDEEEEEDDDDEDDEDAEDDGPDAQLRRDILLNGNADGGGLGSGGGGVGMVDEESGMESD